jgi:hypothetical protein
MWWFLVGCGGDTAPAAVEADGARAQRGIETGGHVQSCAPEPGCGSDPDTLPASRCTEATAPFLPTLLDGALVAVDVDPLAARDAGIAAGRWWSAWRALDGSCRSVFVALVVPE